MNVPIQKKANSINTAYYMYVYMYDVVSSLSLKFRDHNIFTPKPSCEKFPTPTQNEKKNQKYNVTNTNHNLIKVKRNFIFSFKIIPL